MRESFDFISHIFTFTQEISAIFLFINFQPVRKRSKLTLSGFETTRVPVLIHIKLAFKYLRKKIFGKESKEVGCFNTNLHQG
jgi:hypothetical protein